MLPLSYWEALRFLAEPFELMKFTLIFDGDLPAGDNKRTVYASKIRNALHDQLADLWDSHVIFRQLAHTARTQLHGSPWSNGEYASPILPDFKGKNPRPLQPGQVDLVAPIPVTNVGSFIPIIRDSLYLACAIDILFLRHEEPMKLFREGGDLDNRIKCFFDGLRMPNEEEGRNGEALTADPLYCLLEDDRLISDFSVRTGRLLGKGEKARFAVRIQAEVTVKVLRVMDQNQCLIGG
jgi:hypothetical protein